MAKSAASTRANPAKAQPKPQTKTAKLSKGAVAERARKKQQQKQKRYISVVASVLAVFILWAAITSRIDERIANGVQSLWLDASAGMGFQFKELMVEGRRLTHGQDIVAAVGLNVGDSLFLISLEEIRARVMALSTVKNASVTRDLSGRIIVTLTERTPFVLWQHHDRLQVMDDAGVVMPEEDAGAYPYLVTMVGEKAPAHIDTLVAFLSADKQLAKNIVAAVFVSDRRWDIHFANGVKILLPEINPKAAWEKLSVMNRKHDILKQSVQVIDLRVDDRVFITLPEDVAPDDDNAPASDA
jgi:cell division protein FtsQ